MTGLPLIIVFVLAIVVMIVAISKYKIHPFLSIMSVSLILALLAGIPLGDIARVIGAGFSGTFSSIGIVIILGARIGTILEQTGAALKLADMVVKLVGQKNPELAIELMGRGIWHEAGVYSPEYFDPKPYLRLMEETGFEYKIEAR